MPKACLTPEIVDALPSPAKGEKWLGDNHVEHFGVRTWAGKNGGGKAYAIRLRDQFGTVVREAFDPARHCHSYLWDDGWEKPLGHFLQAARNWARDRVAIHRGEPTSADRQRVAWQKRKNRVLSTTIEQACALRLETLRRRSRNHVYVDQIQNLMGMHIPAEILGATFRRVPIRLLADAISKREISYGNVKILRAFVGSIFKKAGTDYGPLTYKLESIQRRCSVNLDRRKAPPYPHILEISEEDYLKFFRTLEEDTCWPQSLAIRLYFATGAKLQQILRARWSDIVDGTWWPFVPGERKLWQGAREPLREEALNTVRLIEQCHRRAKITSPYLFPSMEHPTHHIKSVQRHWKRYCSEFRWTGLPISHVVLRHQPRTNPSYHLFFNEIYLRSSRPKHLQSVSKVVKRRKNLDINAETYR